MLKALKVANTQHEELQMTAKRLVLARQWVKQQEGDMQGAWQGRDKLVMHLVSSYYPGGIAEFKNSLYHASNFTTVFYAKEQTP